MLQPELPVPDVLITGDGTEIRWCVDGALQLDEEWAQLVSSSWKGVRQRLLARMDEDEEGHIDNLNAVGNSPPHGEARWAITVLGEENAKARAAEYQRRMGRLPAFGITFMFRLLPRFYADVSPVLSNQDQRYDHPDRLAILASSLVAMASLFVLASLGWLVSRGGASDLPLLFAGVGVLSAWVCLLRLNPMSRHEGYQLLATQLDTPDLRDIAIAAIFGRGRIWRRLKPKGVSTLAIRVYALAVVLWLAIVAWVLFHLIGVWLAREWAGLGCSIPRCLRGCHVESNETIESAQSACTGNGSPESGTGGPSKANASGDVDALGDRRRRAARAGTDSLYIRAHRRFHGAAQ